MEIKLAENIRAFRKQRSLTQEQLAEVLGVTVGAVYKWEAKLSQPELTMIMAMADFFDTSVDVLLGYEMKDNRLQASVERLKQYLYEKNQKGLAEAEKALKKYPHDFNVVHESAELYCVFGVELQNQSMLLRALELLEQSRLLLPQNTDPQISVLTIYGEMADVYLMLDEGEKAVELLKAHNAGGLYNDVIGLILATNRKRPDEAVPFLSESLLKNTTAIIRTIMGYINVFFQQEDYNSAQAILLWGDRVLSGLRNEDKSSFLDKINSVFHVCLAYTQVKTDDRCAARHSLCHAKELAKRFDAAPDYKAEAILFVDHIRPFSAHDNIGATAMMGIQNTLAAIGDDILSTMWREVNDHEE